MYDLEFALRWLSFFVLSVWTLFITSPVSSQQRGTESRYQTVSPKEGERCIICGVPLTNEDVSLIVRGRRVPLKRTMVDSFMNNQEKYFSRLQPKSALFQENLNVPKGVAQGGINTGWFLFGLYILIALVFGGLSSYGAISKGLSPISNFFIGFIFIVFGYIYVLTRPATVAKGEIPEGLVKVPTTRAPITCSACNSTNHPSARNCSFCGAELTPMIESEVSRTAK